MSSLQEVSSSPIAGIAVPVGSTVAVSTVQSRTLLGTRVDATSYRHLERSVARWIAAGEAAYICVTSVHGIMEAHDDHGFQAVLNAANLITPDGMPLVWGLRLLGVRSATRVYGPDLTDAICAWASRADIPVGFYGSTDAVLDRLIDNLRQRHTGLRVDYRHSPPFRPLTPEERRRELNEIRASGVRLLFVGLGCPKQERWMAERLDELDVVMLGVGAAFDYLARTIKRPPACVQQLGLEWAFRLVCEPRRLWRRYLKNNPRFVLLFARQIIRTRMNGERL